MIGADGNVSINEILPPNMEQAWFEMADVRRRDLNTAVWIPLRASQTLVAVGTYGYEGFRKEFFGAGSLAVRVQKRVLADRLNWGDIGLSDSHKGWFQDGAYVPSDVYNGWGEESLDAVPLVLAQDGNSIDPQEWHLHQDFVVTLGLKRENDTWISMAEEYIEVARLGRMDGRPVRIEVRAEYLKDYLCARGMALLVSSYRSRDEIRSNASDITWTDTVTRQGTNHDRWEGRRVEIHEGGSTFGSSMAVFKVTRKNVDYLNDVPKIGASDENIGTSSRTIRYRGKKLVLIRGEYWRDEWVEPGELSIRIRGDESPSKEYFIVDASGTRCCASDLEAKGGWLWFRPGIVTAVLGRRNTSLRWYTRDTGGLCCSPSSSHLHFGVNPLGLVNVYGKDIEYLPHWAQGLWSGFNVGPEGGVSAELLAAQAEGEPADTKAPEGYLADAFELLNELSIQKFKFSLIRDHDQFEKILAATHRFRSTDQNGLYALAKDIARLTADSIDSTAIQLIAPPAKGEKRGSLKSLEKLIATKIGPDRAREILGPLVGAYELRHGDAHLPTSDVKEALALLHIDSGAPFVTQGYQLLDSCVTALYTLAKVLERFP